MACQDNQDPQDHQDPQVNLLLPNRVPVDTKDQEPCQDTSTHRPSKEHPDHVDPQEAQEQEEHKV